MGLGMLADRHDGSSEQKKRQTQHKTLISF